MASCNRADHIAVVPYFRKGGDAMWEEWQGWSSRTLRKKAALFSGSVVLIDIPLPSSKPAERVTRGISVTYQ